MLNHSASIASALWSCLSGNQRVLTALIDSICNETAERDDYTRAPLFLVAGSPGSGSSALSYQLEFQLISKGKRVLSVERHPEKQTTLFSSDLVCSFKLPEEVSVEFKKHKGKSTLNEVYWHLLNDRHYDVIIVRDAHEWISLKLIASLQSLLGMQELITRFASISVVAFANQESVQKLKYATSGANVPACMFELVPMANDQTFQKFVYGVCRKILSARNDVALLSPEQVKAIHAKSKGFIGSAVKLVQLHLADADNLGFCRSADFKWPLLKPRSGESFSSWMGRLSVEAKNTSHLEAVEIFANHCARVAVDPDKLYELSSIRKCFSSGEQEMFDTFECCSSSYLPFGQSTSYCPECQKVDIKEVGLPAWRLAWRRLDMCVCLEHEPPVMLQCLSTPHYSPLDKAWRAYCEYVSSPSSRLLVSFPLISNGMQAVADNEMLLRLTARVQNWILTDFQINQTPKPSRRVVEFLLGVWLCDPSWRKAPGFACSFFFPQRKGNNANLTLDTSFIDSPPRYSWATPRQLAVAYWMLGVAFGLITRDEAQLIRDVCRPYSLPFPVDRTEIKRVGLGVHGRLIREELIALARSTLTGEDLDQVIWALD
ncbi:hypothetical protein N7D90_12195 [Pseudomonas fragi]|uniref:hypothetical protein n=1 Tax=Pseudomonas fragi TaxID=296 RepID=UPI0021C097A3|nr:hypothetical protein [Pseudomonas fragi]UXL36392.1 hypothetical protein N7D90_12195 [Pseudomonas fragi]